MLGHSQIRAEDNLADRAAGKAKSLHHSILQILTTIVFLLDMLEHILGL